MTRRIIILAVALLVAGCASPRTHFSLQSGASMALEKPRNLSGRPLHAIEADIYTADSLRMTEALAPHNDRLNLLDAMQAALQVTGEERGIVIASDAKVVLHVALDLWDSSALESDGILRAGVTGILIDRDGTTLGEARVERSMKLLTGSGPIAGEKRVIDGRYEALTLALARALLDELAR